MSIKNLIPMSLALALAFGTTSSAAQGRPDPAVLLAAQRAAMKPLNFMDGEWRGQAWTILPTGDKHEVTQTERIGPFLDGAVKVIEGRGYNADGTLAFNSLGVVSFDTAKKAHKLHSYAMGMTGDFSFTAADSGFVWEIPAGPMTIRYTATFRGGTWREIGERVMADQPPVQFFEMNLVRVRDTNWPAAGAVVQK